MDEEQLEQPQLEQEVEDAYKRRGFWDRKLAASLLELEQIKEVMSKYRYDQEEMKKRIRKVKKNSKGLINTIKVLDIQPEDLTEKIESVTLDDVNFNSQES
jgi:hypothetical protein